MVEVERISGGTQVVVCPECRKPVLDSQEASLDEDRGCIVHGRCDIDPSDPQTLAYWSGANGAETPGQE